MTGRGHIPYRTCLVCMKKKPKRDLVRLGLNPENGFVVIDTGGSMKGRGAYACRKCLPGLRFGKRVLHAFRNMAKQIYMVHDPVHK